MATAQQVYSALRIHNVFNVLNTSSPINFSLFDDITDWGGMNISTANGDTVKLLAQVVAPTGITCYENTGYVADDYASPDTTLLDLISPTWNLPVYTGGTVYVNGLYVMNVKVEVAINGGATFIVEKTFTFDLPKNVTPNFELTETWNCSIATYTSTDTTVYCTSGCASGYNVTNIVKTHTVYPPAVSGQSSVTASSTTIVLASPDNVLWTGTYEAKLSAVVTLTQGDSTVITHGSVTKEAKVICDDLLCGLYCQMQKLYASFMGYLGHNTTEANKYKGYLEKGLICYQLATQARLCSKESMVEQYVADFYKLTGTDPNCNCCTDESSPVIPTTIVNGTDGTDGETPEFRLTGDTIFQYKFPSDTVWTTIIDFSTIKGADGKSFLQGSGVPSSGLGSNDDTYLDIDTYDIYFKSAGSWSVTGNIKGDDGFTLLVNDLSSSTTTGTTTEILKTFSIPANTFVSNGDMLVVETEMYSTIGDTSHTSFGYLDIGAVSHFVYSIPYGSTIGEKQIFTLTKTGANTLTIQWDSTTMATGGYETWRKIYRVTQGSLNFAGAITLSLSARDRTAGDTTANLFRITKYKI